MDTTTFDPTPRQYLPRTVAYVTFGTGHAHRVNNTTYDCECIARLVATDEAQCREVAFELFGATWSNIYYHLEELDLNLFPRGIIDVDIPAKSEL